MNHLEILNSIISKRKKLRRECKRRHRIAAAYQDLER